MKYLLLSCLLIVSAAALAADDERELARGAWGTTLAGGETVSSGEVVGSEAVGSGAVGSGAVGSEAVGSGAVDSGAVDSGAVDSGEMSSGEMSSGVAVGSGEMSSGEAVGSEAVGSGEMSSGEEINAAGGTTLAGGGAVGSEAAGGEMSGSEGESNNTEEEGERAEAVFDMFCYEGDDEYYAAHPLPSAHAFYNPILPGWYSDPSICSNGRGDYFLVTSTFVFFPGVPLFHSRDLVNWRQVGNILSRPSQMTQMAGQSVSGGIYAPAISYNAHNDTYYMITTNVGAGTFFVKTRDPFGSWSDPIFLPAVHGIDPSFFFDADGQGYIVCNDDAPDDAPEYDGHRTLRLHAFDVATDTTIGKEQVLVNKGVHPEENPVWIEGPHMYRVGESYFLMSAEGGTGGWHSEVVFRSSSPWGPFVPWEENPILTQRTLPSSRPDAVTCAGHADLVQTDSGDWWAVFLACRPLAGGYENLGRETFLLPVSWSADGWPRILEEGAVVPRIVEVPGAERDSVVTFGNFSYCDTFSAATLGDEWLTLRGAAEDLYSLTAHPCALTLYCAPVSATEKTTPAFVARRVQHHVFTATTHLLFSPKDSASSAGLLLFKDETHQYFLAKHAVDAVPHLSLWQIDEDGKHPLASAAVADEALSLRITSSGDTFTFSYAGADDVWHTLIADVAASFLSTATAGGFTGTVVALYATSKE